MHIAFLTPEYPHPQVNRAAGIATSIKNLASQLEEKGIKVSVFVYTQNTNQVLDDGDIKLHLIKKEKYPILGWYRYRKKIQNYVNGIITKEAIDVVEAPDWTGITAFMKLKSKLVIKLHGTDTYFCKLEKRPVKKKNYFFEKRALQHADSIVSVSDFTARETKRLFKLKKPITTIHNGIDIQRFTPLAIKEKTNTILYFGTIIRKKGILQLVKAFAQVYSKNNQAKLILIGKDSTDVLENKSTLALLREMIPQEVHKAIVHHNHMPYKDVVAHIAASTIVVLPSYAEAFPMTWLEAMAMEKALITSNIGWANELMIDNETGFTVHPDDIASLTNKIEILLASPEMRRRFGTNARKHIVSNFSIADTVQKSIKFYKTLSV